MSNLYTFKMYTVLKLNLLGRHKKMNSISFVLLIDIATPYIISLYVNLRK